MRRILLIATIMFGALFAAEAQEAEFTADRPGASTGPATVAAGVVQWEQGVQYDGDGAKGMFTFSNTLFRFGVTDGFELRLGGDAFIYNEGEAWRPAFSGLTLGTKINIFEGRGAIPEVAVMANLAIPATGNEGFVVEHLAPSLYLLFENPLTDRWSLGYNVGVEWDGTLPAPSAFVALGASYAITDNLGCFVESYNYFSRMGNAYMADAGFSLQVARKVQLDLAANIDLCHPAQAWAVSFGVAWQLNK